MPRVVFGVTVPITATAFLRQQLSEFVSRGWETHLVTSPGDECTDLKAIEGLHLHEIPMRRNPAPISDIAGLARWIILMKQIQPDVIVASTPKTSLLGIVAAWLQRVPVRIYHVRGLRAESATGLVKRISVVAEMVSLNLANSIVADSPSLLRKIELLTGRKWPRSTVLGAGSSCGVNTAKFHPPTAEQRLSARASLGMKADDGVVVGFVGRVTKDKGIHELVEAISRLRQGHPSVRLIVTGPVEDEHLNQLLDKDWIVASKRLMDPTLTYWASDIVCLPSHREEFPISPLEAQACGIAVITTSAAGAVDSVWNQKTGIVVSVGDTCKLCESLEKLILDRST